MAAIQFLKIQLDQDVSLDSSSLEAVVSMLRASPGNIATLWAAQHEDSSIAGVASVWDPLPSQEHLNTSSKDQGTKAAIHKLTEGIIYDDLVLYHEDPRPVLAAKVVELVSFIHKTSDITNEKMEQVEYGFKKFQEVLTTEASQLDGGIIGGWGQVEFDLKGESCRRYSILIGWESVQGHEDCKATAAFTENIHWLTDYEHAGLEMVHFPFSQSIGK